ncbi:MAG: formate dehydrogenase subunit delta [Acetobacteraceae bacterium]
MSPEKLAYMANQIGQFFAAQKQDTAVAGIEDHILKFWDPRMRRDLLAHLDQVKLDPLVQQAVQRLKEKQPA